MQDFVTTFATSFIGGAFGGSTGVMMGVIVGLSVDYFNFNIRQTQQNHESMMLNKIESLQSQLYQTKINEKLYQNKINDLEEMLIAKTNEILEAQFVFDKDLNAPQLSPIPGQYTFIKSSTN